VGGAPAKPWRFVPAVPEPVGVAPPCPADPAPEAPVGSGALPPQTTLVADRTRQDRRIGARSEARIRKMIQRAPSRADATVGRTHQRALAGRPDAVDAGGAFVRS
jgi:hypothetical protein